MPPPPTDPPRRWRVIRAMFASVEVACKAGPYVNTVRLRLRLRGCRLGWAELGWAGLSAAAVETGGKDVGGEEGTETLLVALCPLPLLPQLNCMRAAMGGATTVVATLVLTREVAPHVTTRDRDVSEASSAGWLAGWLAGWAH